MRIMKTVGTLVSVILLTTVPYVGLARSADTGSGIAALVMDMTWTTEPPPTIHREIAAGTQIALVSSCRFFTTKLVPSLPSRVVRSR
jgi:hypothetical protein